MHTVSKIGMYGLLLIYGRMVHFKIKKLSGLVLNKVCVFTRAVANEVNLFLYFVPFNYTSKTKGK